MGYFTAKKKAFLTWPEILSIVKLSATHNLLFCATSASVSAVSSFPSITGPPSSAIVLQILAGALLSLEFGLCSSTTSLFLRLYAAEGGGFSPSSRSPSALKFSLLSLCCSFSRTRPNLVSSDALASSQSLMGEGWRVPTSLGDISRAGWSVESKGRISPRKFTRSRILLGLAFTIIRKDGAGRGHTYDFQICLQ